MMKRYVLLDILPEILQHLATNTRAASIHT